MKMDPILICGFVDIYNLVDAKMEVQFINDNIVKFFF